MRPGQALQQILSKQEFRQRDFRCVVTAVAVVIGIVVVVLSAKQKK